MSRAKAIQTSRDRLVANMLVAIPASVALFMIWLYQKPKAPPSSGTDVDGWQGAPELPL